MASEHTVAKPLRSQPTRDRILKAARRVFAAEGYERATIRAVAVEAKIHASMVMRYYRSKENLFAAASDFDLRLPSLAGIERSIIGRRLVGHFLERWEGPDSNGELQSLLRAASSHDGARAALTEIFERQLMPAVESIDGVADADRRAALVAAQILGLAYARYVIRLPAVVSLDRSVIVEAVGGCVQTYLDTPLP